jgi:drug/metabolite transporter (DMT)-like permease
VEPAVWLWIPVTLWAAFAQTLRNAAQRSLTDALGTLGATLVRFLYGLPFAALWLWLVHRFGGYSLPTPTAAFAAWVVIGAVAQIVATALLLRVMAERNFALGVAYSKSEILQVALFGLVFLGDPISAVSAAAIACGTLGVLLLAPADKERPWRALVAGWTSRTALIGLGSGAAFALSAVGYRGAILSLRDPHFVMAATFTVAVGLTIQSVLLTLYLWLRDRAVLVAIFRAWKPSLFAGFMGALASQFWFLGFATATAASVRTLALVEVLFAQAISRLVFKQRATQRELVGIALIVVGVVLLLWAY